ncbi:MAG: hypothetical protein ACOC59_00510 [Bacteroidota bacterium]
MNQKIKIIDSIRDVPVDAYNRVIEQYIDAISSNPHVLAVYQLGTVRNPGISDLDLIVVVDDVIDPMRLNGLRARNEALDGYTKYIFVHDVLVYNRTAFLELHYHLFADDLKLLFGRPLKIAMPPPEEKIILGLQILFDYTAGKLSQFKRLLAGSKLDSRGILLRVGSLKHSANLLKAIGIQDDSLDKFVTTVLEARCEPCRLSVDQIANIFMKSFFQFTRVANLASEHFERKHLGYYSMVDNSVRFRLNTNQAMVFTDCTNLTERQAYQLPLVYYPTAAFFHVLSSMGDKSFLSMRAGQHLSHRGDEIFEINETYRSVRHRRLQSLSDHFAFLHHNRLGFSVAGNPGFVFSCHGIPLPPCLAKSAIE